MYVPTGGRIFEGVGGEILHDLVNPRLVGHHVALLRNVPGEGEVFCLHGALQPPEGVPGKLAQGEGVPGELHLSRLQPGEIQHFQHHGVHALRLGEEDGQVLLPLVFGNVLL